MTRTYKDAHDIARQIPDRVAASRLLSGAARKRVDPDELWCRQNVTPEESSAFWKNWCETQWGMPTFNIMRQCVLATRAKATGAA